jgi:tyrosyl-tRNA synthetase
MLTLVELLVMVGWARSKSQARRHIQSGAIRINDVKVTDVDRFIYQEDFMKRGEIGSDLQDQELASIPALQRSQATLD